MEFGDALVVVGGCKEDGGEGYIYSIQDSGFGVLGIPKPSIGVLFRSGWFLPSLFYCIPFGMFYKESSTVTLNFATASKDSS